MKQRQITRREALIGLAGLSGLTGLTLASCFPKYNVVKARHLRLTPEELKDLKAEKDTESGAEYLSVSGKVVPGSEVYTPDYDSNGSFLSFCIDTGERGVKCIQVHDDYSYGGITGKKPIVTKESISSMVRDDTEMIIHNIPIDSLEDQVYHVPTHNIQLKGSPLQAEKVEVEHN